MLRFLKNWWRVSLTCLLLVIFATSCTVGCPFWTGDPLDGTVVDANTGRPIPGAVVAFTVKYRVFVPDRAFDLAEEHVTDSKGEFHIARWFLFGIGEPTWHEPTLIIHREGYATQVYKNDAFGYHKIVPPFVRWKRSPVFALEASRDSIDAHLVDWTEVIDRLTILGRANDFYRCGDIARLPRTIRRWQEVAMQVQQLSLPRTSHSLLMDRLPSINRYIIDCSHETMRSGRE